MQPKDPAELRLLGFGLLVMQADDLALLGLCARALARQQEVGRHSAFHSVHSLTVKCKESIVSTYPIHLLQGRHLDHIRRDDGGNEDSHHRDGLASKGMFKRKARDSSPLANMMVCR